MKTRSGSSSTLSKHRRSARGITPSSAAAPAARASPAQTVSALSGLLETAAVENGRLLEKAGPREPIGLAGHFLDERSNPTIGLNNNQ